MKSQSEKYWEFSCECKFPLISEDPFLIDFDPDINTIPLDCDRTWELIAAGNTKGVFQLESPLGRSKAKQLRPRNIDQLAALTAILRPGCVSGDTEVITRIDNARKYPRHIKIPIKKLFDNQRYYGKIISYNEQTGSLEPNKMLRVVYNGKKDVYRVHFKRRLRNFGASISESKFDDLKCTKDHELLTPDGWKELQNIKSGERIAVLKYNGTQSPRKHIAGKKYFKEICFKHYEYRCIFCDWQDGSLDVNHIEGNRDTNNDASNLHFVCPNHHRMYTENTLTKQDVLSARQKYELPQKQDILWAEYTGNTSLGEQEVYDILMEGPHHNFIAGNTIVHNCMDSIRDGKSITQHYIDRKNGEEEIENFHPALEPILGGTYGEMIYQEQAMRIAQDIAGFDLQQADILRKAIGKKKADIMASLEKEFLDGCKRIGLVNEEQAKEIFEWIRKSQRYSFNKSHSVSYAMTAYLSAYCKAHFPEVFFTSYLYYSKKKAKEQEEVFALISNARNMGIDVLPPRIEHLNKNFTIADGSIHYGFTNIKGIGDAAFAKMCPIIDSIPYYNWQEFLIKVAPHLNATVVKALINSGSLSTLNNNRTRMAFEYDQISELTVKEVEWLERHLNEGHFDNLLDGLIYLESLPTGRGAGKGLSSKRRTPKIRSLILSLQKPPYRLQDNIAWIADIEQKLFGVSLTCTEVESCDISVANCTCREFIQGFNKPNNGIFIAGKVENIREITDKNDKKMAFVVLGDSTGTLESVVVFSNQWVESKSRLIQNNTVMISGERGREKDSFIVNKVWQI